MSGKFTNRPSAAEGPSRGRADLARLRRERDDREKETSPDELGDLPDDFWDDADIVVPEAKQAISIRVDRDVLAWFRKQGPGYQSRMNAVLRSFMEARLRR